ncbi:MAG TPA: ABC transporter substrate-binding protein [Acidimicrobiia bacterium]|nr:ABC transporter substrate-binding protein [Acidimicrobiia bacterium]
MGPASRGRRGNARAAAVLLALALGACGTRVDRDAYYAQFQTQSGAAAGDTSTAGGSPPADIPAEAVDDPAATGTAGIAAPSSGTARAPRATTSTIRRAGATAASGPAGPAGPAAPLPATAAGGTAGPAAGRPGVSAEIAGDVVRIGFHVPETGAAPMPTDWKDAIAVIEDHINQNPIHGRRVDFLVEDDGYDPSQALAACRKLADGNALFVVGHTAPGAEDACAGLFQSRGVPYLLRGISEEALEGRPLAWFGTIPDGVQGRLLADYALNRLGGHTKKSAVIFANDQVAGPRAFEARLRAGGGPWAGSEEVNPHQSDYSAVVQKLQQAGAELVHLSLPPVSAIKIAVQAQGQGYHPVWLGGASYWNYNMVLEAAGSAMDGAISFSPWPSVDSADAAEYRATFQRARPGKEPTDIGLVFWGWGNLIRTALEKTGPALSRSSLADALDTLEFTAPYWNPVRYRPGDRRGTGSVAVFRADGQARRWRQISGFTDRF